MKKAFSLVELSIVLVILGLLVGGILAGQSLIRAAELRAVTTEYQRYTTAVNAFRDKYFSIPGDMPIATRFWGTAAVCPGIETNPSSTVTCDGNGDGYVAFTTGSNEIFRFWQHMANAGLIEGQYTGVRSCAINDYCAQAGLNMPASKLSTGIWGTHSRGTLAPGHATLWAGNYGSFYTFGSRTTAAAGGHEGAVLKPEEAWNIDTKLDDGKPGTGTVISTPWGGGCNNAASSSDYGATYALTITTPTCALGFLRAY